MVGPQAIAFRPAPTLGVRYMFGRTVYDEAFVDGRLVGRYWSPHGQVLPEMHLPIDRLRQELRQAPLAAFRLAIEGEELDGGWQWVDAQEEVDHSGLGSDEGAVRQVVITLAHNARRIEVRVCTRLDGSDWLVRWLEISNRGSVATAISSVYPMAGRLWSHRYDEHLPSGVASPFEAAYNHGTTWGHEGDLWFEQLPAGKLVFDGGRNGKSGWSRPAFWARDLANGQSFVCELAWSGNWQFELDCRLSGSQQGQLCFAIGLPPLPELRDAGATGRWHGEALRVLAPGETVYTPAVHIGCSACDVDSIVQSMHEHVRHAVLARAPAGREVEIEANHRGYLCDRENEPGLVDDIDVAAEVGAEMYVVDAGWFGNEPNKWWNNVGDWFAGAWLPNGLEPVREHARQRGLRFGLWVEIEAAGANSTLRKEHPDWLARRHGELLGEGNQQGRMLDLSKPEVAAWVESEIERIIRRYDLDMFRVDHNHSMGLGATCQSGGFVENTLWRYYDALYAIFDRLRAKFPQVVFQNCCGGGGRLDLGMLSHFHNTEESDWMRQPRGLLIHNGLTMSLPPEILLRTFGTEAGEHALDADLDSQLRLACLGRPIFRGIAPALAALKPMLEERVKHHVRLYKEFIRPVMTDGLVFHHTPWLPLGQPAPWCVLEYASKDKSQAVVGIFRLCQGSADVYHFRPRGLRRDRRYRVTFDNSREVVEMPGAELINGGLAVRVANVFSSELVLFSAVG
jgi:alpha-galactosidase